MCTWTAVQIAIPFTHNVFVFVFFRLLEISFTYTILGTLKLQNVLCTYGLWNIGKVCSTCTNLYLLVYWYSYTNGITFTNIKYIQVY